VHLMGMHLMGVYLMGVHLMGVILSAKMWLAPARTNRTHMVWAPSQAKFWKPEQVPHGQFPEYDSTQEESLRLLAIN
jgi:hypothetical protein